MKTSESRSLALRQVTGKLGQRTCKSAQLLQAHVTRHTVATYHTSMGIDALKYHGIMISSLISM